jgi:predicted DNA-binding transcriptional regulator YafY
MDQPKFERLLRLMRLLSGNVTYSIDELADKLEMSERTIYRYIDTFKAAGFAVEKLYGNIYRLTSLNDDTLDLSKLVYFSEEEAAIVNNMIDGLDNTNALKTGLKRKLAAVYDSTSISSFIGNRSNAANVQALADAIKGKSKVILHGYESSNSGQVRDRLVEPFAFTTNYVDVWCYDLEDGRNKIFKISRVGEVEILLKAWTEEDRHHLQPADVFRIHGNTSLHIRLKLSQRAKNLLLEEYPLAEKSVHKVKGDWVFDGYIHALQGAGRFITGLAQEVEILEGDELRDYVRAYMKDALNSSRL